MTENESGDRQASSYRVSDGSIFDRVDDVSSYVRTVTWFNLLLAVQIAVGLTYVVLVDAMVPSVRYSLIPFLWITIGGMAVWYTKPADRPIKYVAVGVTVAAGYFLLVLYLAGMVVPVQSTAGTVNPSGLSVEWQRPLGWAPIVDYTGSWLSIRLIPYQVFGYLALSYLIYAAILNISSSITTGVIGLVPCPGCAAPVLAPLLAGAAGTSSAFVFLIAYTHEIATVLFVAAVGLLYWQPTLETLVETLSRNLSPITGGFALLVAGLHLFDAQLGFPRLVQYVQLGTLYDPRPLLFTLSGLAILVGVVLVSADVARRPIYLLGIGLMLAYLGGYVAWHTVLDHGGFWPHIEAHGHHDRGMLETVLSHLLDDPRALASKGLELAVLVCLVALYRRE